MFSRPVRNNNLTLSELKVGRKRSLVGLGQKQVALRNCSEQQLNGDAQLVHGLLKADRRGGSLAQRLGQVL